MLWLYDEFETDFTYNGIVLNNAYDSDIHWVLNTMYKLTFKYPTVDNDLYSFIEKGMIVKADEHDRTNLFRIKDIDISENDKCITVTAYQKNYDFSKRLVNNFSRVRVNCMSVLDEWYSQFLSSEKDFSYYSDIIDINSFSTYKDEKDNQPKSSFDLLGEIASLYSADIDMHDKQISLLRKLGRDTEEVLTTAKNISEFVNTSNSDEIVTRIYATTTFRVGDKDEKKDLQTRHREELRALRQSQKEYSQSRNAEKKSQQIQEEIAKKYAKELAKQNKSVKRSGTTSKSYSQIESEVRAKYQVREQKAQVRKAESQALADRKKSEIESLKARQKDEAASLDEEITISLIIESPLINDYPFINEISISNNDLRTAEELEEWAMEYFTKGNIDKPKNSIKVTYEQLSENINRGDTVILKYLKYGIDERIRVVETHYDPMLKKWKEFILGEKEGRLGSEVSHSSSGAEVRANAYTDRLSMDIDRRVEERSKNYDELFKKNTDKINKKIEDGFEKAKASSEVTIAKIDEDLEKKLVPIRNQVSTTVENYNRQFQATNLEISKNRVEATKQIQVLSNRVNNMQDISSNSTVVELRGLVNGATSKVTELETSIIREFTTVKKKNEDSLSAVKAEFTKGVDGLTSKIASLEEYKNQDGTRTESLKQWVQRDTASQLSRERTEINKIIDNKDFVKNTEFGSKFTESARGITNQLSALENYKNQDGVRVANMQIWAQNNTANQLTAERRNIEKWINDKGYATTSVLENKVQETANSFSREISNFRNSIPTSLGGRNYIIDSKNLNAKIHWGSGKWDETVDGDTIILTKKGGSDKTGFWFNLTDLVKTQFQNETLTWSIEIKASRNITLNSVGFETNGQTKVDVTTNWKRYSYTFVNRFTNYYMFTFNNPTTNFNNGDKIYIKLPKLETGNIATDWTPAPEDTQQSINELNTWKQTATGTLNTVTSTLNDTVRHAQLRIGADKIDFGSNKVFDGRNLASMLSVSPESIQAITDKLVITPANENLVLPEFRETVISNSRDKWITPLITGDKLQNGDQFIIEGVGSWYGRLTQSLNFTIEIQYKTGSYTWKFPVIVGSNEYSTNDTLKCTLTVTGLTGEVKSYKLGLLQNGSSNFINITFKNAKIYKKKSAELIVDGSIEGRQIKTNTLETGHHKAGSITSEIIAANAVKAKHVLIDDGLIHNLLTHNAFINKLWAQQAFINKLNAVKIRSTQIDTDTLNGVVISGQSKIKIGQYGFLQPIEKGLQINVPENFGSKRGIGLQIAGEGVGPKESGVPPGLFIYEDPDFTRGNTVPSAVNRVLLTVAGMACFSSRILGSVVKGQPILTNLDYSSPFSNHAPVKFIGYKEGGFMRFFSTDNSNSDIWNIKVDQWGSDRKLKTDIKDSEFNAIEFVDKLKFKEHGWNKDEVGYERPYTKCGLIAQELQALDESLVVDYETYLGLDALRLINIALKAVQELSQQNKELKQKLEEITNG
nr:MAG TPA: tail protein [Caudoviricetes sp.]